ncbi:MAG: tripartite tricarboxylate transporter TctB family protein [Hyphomicrobiaceae bacterium]|nr:tripartite tricarboxylate transporter TctB family protein [Hyphomicrobiaceae bacterium]
MRKAEFVMAVVMGIFSLYLMWKSAELPIGWIPEEGPGGGAWPFWLSAIMAICCVMILVNWYRRKTPPSQSDEVYMDRGTLIAVGLVAGALTVTIALFYVIGVYGAIPLFMIFYVRFLGRHSWATTAAMATITPVVMFFFFDIALKITLPKGLPIVEETIFYPLYKIFL